jgi:hypothetical protein
LRLPSAGSKLPSFGWKLVIDAQASISVPAIEKWSSKSTLARIAHREGTYDVTRRLPLAVSLNDDKGCCSGRSYVWAREF